MPNAMGGVKMRKTSPKGSNTADWPFARYGFPAKMYGFQRGMMPFFNDSAVYTLKGYNTVIESPISGLCGSRAGYSTDFQGE